MCAIVIILALKTNCNLLNTENQENENQKKFDISLQIHRKENSLVETGTC